MKIVTIDGDLYGMVIPSSDDCFGIMETSLDFADSFCVVKKEKENAYVFNFFSAQVIKGSIYYTNTYCSQKPFQPMVDYTSFGNSPAEYLINFRPCLVPLNKDGKPDDEIAKSTPNGTLMIGGHPYLNGVPFKDLFPPKDEAITTYHMKRGPEPSNLEIKPLPYQYKLPFQWNGHDDFTIGDSTGDPEYDLKWFTWGGRLVCLNALVKMRPIELPNVADIYEVLMPIDRRTKR